MSRRYGLPVAAAVGLGAACPSVFAAGTNLVALSSNLPEVGGSLVRMLVGLGFVLALFFGGVWVFKNWQRVTGIRSQSKLHIVEARSLGPRQAIYVVGHERQRFLIAASPAGISLLIALPEAGLPDLSAAIVPNGVTPFAQVLQKALGRK